MTPVSSIIGLVRRIKGWRRSRRLKKLNVTADALWREINAVKLEKMRKR